MSNLRRHNYILKLGADTILDNRGKAEKCKENNSYPPNWSSQNDSYRYKFFSFTRT